jgi:broad specificity phosphatase PhoE
LRREGNPNWDHIDPKLTKLGIDQATHLKELFRPTNQVTHILFSPLCRARQTAAIVFRKTVFENGLKMVAYPDLREWSAQNCATGVSLSQLKEDCKLEQLPIDINLVPENWEENNEFGKGRCKRVRKSLWTLGHEAMKKEGGLWHGVDVSRGRIHRNIEIVLVSHGGFLVDLTNSSKGIIFRNCQWRTYEFATEEMIKNGERQKYDLVETGGSKQRVYAMPGGTVSN